MSNEKDNNDLRQDILTNELGNIMLDMISPIYDRSKIVLYLFQAISTVLQKETDFISYDFIDQMFIQTATWGLKYWEEEYGVTPNPLWNYEQRRMNLLSAVKYKAPITPKKIEDRLSSLLNIEVSVNEIPGESAFEVVFHDLILDHSQAHELIDKISPAHLTYSIKTQEEEDSGITNYYKITVSEMESSTVTVCYSILVDEFDNTLVNELDETLTV